MSNQTRIVTKEYDLGYAAAEVHVAPSTPIDLTAQHKSAFAAGYARALMDVADGKVKPPKPDWRNP